MKIFVAGATGAVGRRLVPLLVSKGYTVVGTTRTPAKADVLRAAGATPVVFDAWDRDTVIGAVSQAEPGVVVHELTALTISATSVSSTRASQPPIGSERREPTTCSRACASCLFGGSSRSPTPGRAFTPRPVGPSRPRTTRSIPILPLLCSAPSTPCDTWSEQYWRPTEPRDRPSLWKLLRPGHLARRGRCLP